MAGFDRNHQRTHAARMCCTVLVARGGHRRHGLGNNDASRWSGWRHSCRMSERACSRIALRRRNRSGCPRESYLREAGDQSRRVRGGSAAGSSKLPEPPPAPCGALGGIAVDRASPGPFQTRTRAIPLTQAGLERDHDGQTNTTRTVHAVGWPGDGLKTRYRSASAGCGRARSGRARTDDPDRSRNVCFGGPSSRSSARVRWAVRAQAFDSRRARDSKASAETSAAEEESQSISIHSHAGSKQGYYGCSTVPYESEPAPTSFSPARRIRNRDGRQVGQPSGAAQTAIPPRTPSPSSPARGGDRGRQDSPDPLRHHQPSALRRGRAEKSSRPHGDAIRRMQGSGHRLRR